MTTERSDKVHDNWRQGAEKFDYFVLGVTGALCAYISQTYTPEKLGFNSGTIELLSLILLVCAAVAGFKRVETTIEITRLNHRVLRANEERGALISKSPSQSIVNESTGDILSPQRVQQHLNELALSIPTLDLLITKTQSSALRWYRIRNLLILVGFVVLVFAKILSAYI